MKYQYADMAANETEQEEAIQKRMQIRAQLNRNRDRRTELFQERDAIEKKFEGTKQDIDDPREEIEEMTKEIVEKKEVIVQKNKEITRIIEAFFRSVDVFSEKAAKAMSIDQKIEATLRAAGIDPGPFGTKGKRR
jgi:chromosome segregation ATPase